MKIVNVKLTNAQIRELVISAENRLWNLKLYGADKKEEAIITRALKSLKIAIKDVAGVA